ncbi:MAG: hypothetical protein U9P11_08560 [Pseudomonadota bacterium]|nr:hypothetical protein [Pseudomonadota bacterium]
MVKALIAGDIKTGGDMNREKPDKGKGTASKITPDNLQLGITNLELELESRADVLAVAQALANQAERSLLLHTEDLEHAIYDQTAFLEAVSRLARSHKQARIWILIQDARKLVQHGHRLIELSRKLGSCVQFRRPGPEYRNFHETFLLADDAGYLHRLSVNRYEGNANFNDPGKTREWSKYFLEVWDRSEPDEEIRHLHL